MSQDNKENSENNQSSTYINDPFMKSVDEDTTNNKAKIELDGEVSKESAVEQGKEERIIAVADDSEVQTEFQSASADFEEVDLTKNTLSSKNNSDILIEEIHNEMSDSGKQVHELEVSNASVKLAGLNQETSNVETTITKTVEFSEQLSIENKDTEIVDIKTIVKEDTQTESNTDLKITTPGEDIEETDTEEILVEEVQQIEVAEQVEESVVEKLVQGEPIREEVLGVETLNFADASVTIDSTVSEYSFSGNSDEYTITDNGDGTFTVTNTLPGRDGSKVVNDNSDFNFADKTYTTSGGEITGTVGDDEISGGAGADSIEGGVGVDSLSGGDGADTLSGGDGDDVITGGLGDDLIEGGAGSDTLNLTGNQADYTVTDNGDGTYTIFGSDGTDTISGVETLNFADASVTIDSAVSEYSFTGNSDEYTITDNGDGTFTVTDTLPGRDGSKVVNDNSDFNFADKTYTTSGGEITGTVGDDEISGGAGADEGGVGVDSLSGGDGADTLSGGDGDDVITGGLGDDLIEGGAGSDTLNLTGNQADYTVTDNGNGSYTISGPDGTDTISGVETLNFADASVTIDSTVSEYSFSGNSDEYTITDNGDGTFTVTDTLPGRDGSKVVNDNSTFNFADKSYTTSGGEITGTVGDDEI